MNASGLDRRVAVVGAGPAGVYAVQEALNLPLVSGVDLYDALPAPFGLVRYGVAADHMRTKSVVRVLDDIIASDGVRFFGDVRLGKDIELADLRRHYDAIVLATGAPGFRSLGIPGEDLAGCHDAGDFVSWYSAHPDALTHELRHARTAVVVGAGNVALDVARILAKDVAELATTDMPDAVIEVLSESALTDIHILVRRGPEHAKFSAVELRELGELEGVELVVDPAEVSTERVPESVLEGSRSASTTLRILRGWLTRERPSVVRRRIHFHFSTQLAALHGETALRSATVSRSVPAGGSSADVREERYDLPVEVVFKSIGYRAHPIPGVPFDAEAAVVPHSEGRVLDPTGVPVPGLYVCGWLKRGPQGVIGTNKNDAHQTVTALGEDLSGLAPREVADPAAMPALLSERGVSWVDQSGWRRLADHELHLGVARGAVSVKVADRQEMRRVIRLSE